MSQYVEELDNATFNKINDDGLAIVDYWASWCMPCKMLAPIYESVAAEMADKLSFYKINIDQSQEIATASRVNSIPTLIIYSNGKEVSRVSGYRSKENLIQDINKAIANK